MGFFLDIITELFDLDNTSIQQVDQTIEEKCMDLLYKSTYENTHEFSLNNINTWAKVLKVYDGDTLHLAFILGDNKVRFRCRLQGIDCGELKSNNYLEAEKALEAKNYLEQFVNNTKTGLVWVVYGNMDKYGRPLVTLYSSKKAAKNKYNSINQKLIDKRLAYKYDGGKRIAFENWYEGCTYQHHNTVDDNIQDSEIYKIKSKSIIRNLWKKFTF